MYAQYHYPRRRKGVLSPNDLAVRSGLSEATIRRRCESGEIPAIKNSIGCWEITPEEAEEYVARNGVVSDPDRRWETTLPGKDRPYHTPTSLAARVGKSPSTITRYCKAGRIRAIIPSGIRPHIKIPLDAAEEFIAELGGEA